MGIADPSSAHGNHLSGNNGRDVAPSVSSSLEHLMASGQGLIANRIDLALLETQELLSRSGQRALRGIAGILLVMAAWFATAAALVLWLIPEASLALKLAAFGLLNTAAAVVLAAFAARRGHPAPRNRPVVALAHETAPATQGN